MSEIDNFIKDKYNNFKNFVEGVIKDHPDCKRLQGFLYDDPRQFLLSLKVMDISKENLKEDIEKLSNDYNINIEKVEKDDYDKFLRYIELFLDLLYSIRHD